MKRLSIACLGSLLRDYGGVIVNLKSYWPPARVICACVCMIDRGRASFMKVREVKTRAVTQLTRAHYRKGEYQRYAKNWGYGTRVGTNNTSVATLIAVLFTKIRVRTQSRADMAWRPCSS